MRSTLLQFIAFVALGSLASAQVPSTARSVPEWVKRSDTNTQLLLDVGAKFSPEEASGRGIEAVDTEILDLKPGYRERFRAGQAEAVKILKARLVAEKDPKVAQDLRILIEATERSIKGSAITQKYYVPYFSLPRRVFFGMNVLLNAQSTPKRREAAVVRLRKYAGLEPGTTPMLDLCIASTREGLKRLGLLPPIKTLVEQELANSDTLMDGVGQLVAKYQVPGYEEPLARLKQQVAVYNDFVRRELLPKARTDFHMPPEQYRFNLAQSGIDIPPQQLAEMAHKAFGEYQAQMESVAAQVAKAQGFASTDYRDVIRDLKKEQLVGEAIVPHYENRLKNIEEIIQREHLVTLPNRPAQIRLATAAETAANPVPQMMPPRLIGNQGEHGTFVLPLNLPPASGENAETLRYNDFTFGAASWTLIAHEVRPGHELQFDAMVEHGVSQARVIYALNGVNAEGWGLYAEWVLQPYMPLDGQLISLQFRLLRAARAFLDPELQSGKLTREQALAILERDVVLSQSMATQEVDRYTLVGPGQAPAYFYGFTKLLELRGDVERLQGKNFNQQKFHDTILSEGLLPPNLLHKAVYQDLGLKQ